MTKTTRLKRVAFAGAVVLSSIQTACVSEDALGGEDLASAEQASDYSGSSGSGSGSGNSCDTPPPPCPSRCGYSCATIPAPAQGNYPAVKTSGYAVTTYNFKLRATKYTVPGTLRQGKHTGVGITVDTKTDWEHFWCEDTNADGIGDTTRRAAGSWTTEPDWVSNTYNHGRTVLTSLNSVNNTVTFKTGGKQPKAYKDAMLACIGYAGTNGFCDYLCGNDSYTVPDLAKNDGDDPHPDDPMPFTNRRNYGVSATSDPARWSHIPAGMNPFEHYRVPRFGHNSNSDANAQNYMMGRCNSFRGWLDGAYDTLVNASYSCGPDEATIQAQLNSHIRATCVAECGGLKLANFNNPAMDNNVAANDSKLSGADGTNAGIEPGAMPFCESGNYIQGPYNYLVYGM